MVDTSKLSKYLKVDNIRDGEVINFIDAGTIVEKEWKKDGKVEKKPALEITVEFRGEKKTYCPNGTSVGILTKAWGANTEGWVGKQARLNIIPAPNGKDMIIAKSCEDDKDNS